MATLLEIGKQPATIAPAKGDVFKLEELQGYVDGYIETIRLNHREQHGNQDWMIVNEEGRLKGLRPNPAASFIAKQLIVGNAVIATFRELNGREEWEPEESE
jgi:Domain of unknown function (DUF3846)